MEPAYMFPSICVLRLCILFRIGGQVTERLPKALWSSSIGDYPCTCGVYAQISASINLYNNNVLCESHDVGEGWETTHHLNFI
ncbi:hypothetical protein HanIR_Chr11g0549481 [Helianthus annuus]|nr:hypothetical protein HanIR_Chr11g0549481 [Helianthus annuus]